MSKSTLNPLVTRALHEARQFPVTGLTNVIKPLVDTLHQLIDDVYSDGPHTGGEFTVAAPALESIGGVLERLTSLESETGFEVPRVHGPLPAMVLQEEDLDADEAEALGFDSTGRTHPLVRRITLSDDRTFVGFIEEVRQ